LVIVITVTVEFIAAIEFTFVRRVIGIATIANEVRINDAKLMEAFAAKVISRIIEAILHLWN
jgi:hypothetical protein